MNRQRCVVRSAKFPSIADNCPNTNSTSGIKMTMLNKAVLNCLEWICVSVYLLTWIIRANICDNGWIIHP